MEEILELLPENVEPEIELQSEDIIIGGSGQTDVFILRWVSGPIDKNNLSPEQRTDIEYNLVVLENIFSAQPGNYNVYIDRLGRLVSVNNVLSLRSQGVMAIDLYENDLLHILQIGGSSIANYRQAETIMPALDFDEQSDAAAAMSAIAEYITGRCGAFGDIATKEELDNKYTLPIDGIPKEALSQAIRASLEKADTALQSIPSEYVTETYVDDAISNAIGNAIGGAY